MDNKDRKLGIKQGRASYFSRSMIPHGGKEFLYHVGIYGFIYKTGTKQL